MQMMKRVKEVRQGDKVRTDDGLQVVESTNNGMFKGSTMLRYESGLFSCVMNDASIEVEAANA